MLSDGSLFFTTAAALVPGDINEQDDVYEFEDGAPHLISGGTSPSASVFLDASEDGQDVYFTTSEALVLQDSDEITDVYDARVDGGFPASSEFVAPPACKGGEECQPPPSEPPAKPSLASTAFTGAGNLTPPPPPATTTTVTKKVVVKCAKGKKLSHGKCVKPKKKKKKAKTKKSDHTNRRAK